MKSGKKLVLICLLVLGVVIAGALVRRQFRGEGRPDNSGAQISSDLMEILQSYDANNDGMLTKDELPQRMQGLVSRGDTNGDGALSKDELNAMVNAQAAQDSQRFRKGRKDRRGE